MVVAAVLLAGMGRHAEAIAEAKRAKQLDPLSVPVIKAMGMIYCTARRYDLAIAQFRQLAELETNDLSASYYIAGVYERMGKYQEAVKFRQRVIRLQGQPLAVEASLDSTYRRSGREGYWRWHLGRMTGSQDRWPVRMAKFHAQLGERDQAFAWLEKAFASHDPKLWMLKAEPYWDPLRDDPRYLDLLQRMNLAER